jgi:hypothetical protein
MKLPLVISLLLASITGFSQEWHNATDTLKPPNSQGHGQVSTGFNNKFDTVSCTYKLEGSPNLQKGYKCVFVFEGFFIDMPNTLNVFFDDKLQRINKVEKFYFN